MQGLTLPTVTLITTDYVQLDHIRHTGSQTAFKLERVGLYQPIARGMYLDNI